MIKKNKWNNDVYGQEELQEKIDQNCQASTSKSSSQTSSSKNSAKQNNKQATAAVQSQLNLCKLKDLHVRFDPEEEDTGNGSYTNLNINRALLDTMNQRFSIDGPGVEEFHNLSRKFPSIRFSLSFEKQMNYMTHKKFLRSV